MKFDVIILAGGLGTRLASVVNDVPKPMAPVAGKPFLDHILDALPLEHINSIILSVGHKSNKVIEYYGEIYKNIPVIYSIEQEPLGTGGGISLAMNHVTQNSALILNGDTFFDVNFEEFWRTHQDFMTPITLALKQMKFPDRYGTVLIEKNTLVKFQEKQKNMPTGLINGGSYWVNKDIIELLPKTEKYSFEKDFLEVSVSKKYLGGYISDGLFIDIGIPEDYERAQQIFA
ncbi:MAG: nucleotidyltransferase family protein [Bacteroidia bacterium]|nr:nucleotidyltransferase family protein [Bacteroidia bacterium]